jgi:hypothetical protein
LLSSGRWFAESWLNSLGAAMAFIFFMAICFPACAFYVYVLIGWMRDTHRKVTARLIGEDQSRESREPKRPYIVGAGPRPANLARRSRTGGLACPECERQVYENIARSWSSARRA